MSMQASSAAQAMAGKPMSSSSIVADTVTGSHVLKIEGYSQIQTKGLSKGKSIKSSAFDLGGHRWYINYYPDGPKSDDASWISFYLILRHTDAEAAVVRARFRLSLLDEMGKPVQPYSTAWSKIHSFKTAHRGWGYSRFIKKAALEESTYLKDDCFRVRCDVTVSMGFRVEDTTQFVMVPPSDMHQHLACLLQDEEGADVTFQVAGDKFAAHRYVPAARSPVFKAELFGPMKEKGMSSIRIDDMEARVLKSMLHFIYTDTMPDIDKEDAFVITQHLLVAADRYALERLKLICEGKLCHYIDTSTVATTLVLAEQHGCHGLKKACFNVLKSPNHLSAAMANDGFDHLLSSCPSVIKELLAKVAHCP